MDIVLFSPIPFDDLHQRPQKLAELFRDRGARVLFVEPSGVRDAFGRGPLSFVAALLGALVRHTRALPGARPAAPARRAAAHTGVGSLEVVRGPLTVPVHRTNSGFLTAWTLAVHRRFLVDEVLPRVGAGAVAVAEHPMWGGVLEPGDFAAVRYDCLDDFLSFAGKNSPERYTGWERRLLELGGGAFASARVLEEHLHALVPGAAVQRVGNGVDVDGFRERAASAPCAEIARRDGRRIAGYVGVLGRWLDWDLVDGLLNACPEIDFVFVGPVENPETITRLSRHANFRWLPRRPYADVPGIVAAFDACLIPFAAGPVARSTNPVKVFEYFALGKPVVTTPLVELEPYRDAGLVAWADGVPAFAAAVRTAVADADPALAARRLDVARANTWRARADEMLAALAAAAGSA